jgi:hypothetical protein
VLIQLDEELLDFVDVIERFVFRHNEVLCTLIGPGLDPKGLEVLRLPSEVSFRSPPGFLRSFPGEKGGRLD